MSVLGHNVSMGLGLTSILGSLWMFHGDVIYASKTFNEFLEIQGYTNIMLIQDQAQFQKNNILFMIRIIIDIVDTRESIKRLCVVHKNNIHILHAAYALSTLPTSSFYNDENVLHDWSFSRKHKLVVGALVVGTLLDTWRSSIIVFINVSESLFIFLPY
ncbi:hypothetical protein ACJX0J_030754 [Zea mays]